MNYWRRISSINRTQVAAADQEVAMQQRQMAAEVGNTDARNPTITSWGW